MTELYIFIIAFVVSFIGILIPGMTSALGVSSMVLIGVPIQIAKTTFQIGSGGTAIGGFFALKKTQKITQKILIPLFLISIVSGYIGGNILISIPTNILMKLTGIFMILLLGVNIFFKSLGLTSSIPSQKRKVVGFIMDFFLNIFYSIFPMGVGVLFQFVYTFFFGLTHLESRYITVILSIPFIIAFLIPIIQSGLYNISYIGLYVVGGYIGGYLGAHSGLKLGNTILKKILMVWLFCLGIYFLFFAKV